MSPASDPLATFWVSDFSCVRMGWAAAVMSEARNGSAMKRHPLCTWMLCRPLVSGNARDRRCTGVLDGGGAFLAAGFQGGQCRRCSQLAQGIDGQQREVLPLFSVGPTPFGQERRPIRHRIISRRDSDRMEDVPLLRRLAIVEVLGVDDRFPEGESGRVVPR